MRLKAYMISSLKVEGYKSIKSAEIELNNINIIIGSNGVGKSNLISTFDLIRSIHQQNLQNYVISKGGAESILHFGLKYTDAIKLQINFHNSNSINFNLNLNQDKLYIANTHTSFNDESGSYGHGHKNKTYENEWDSNVYESEFIHQNHGQAYWINPILSSLKVFHFHDTGDKSPIKSQSLIHDNELLKYNGSNLASFLYLLKERYPKHYIRIEKTIQSIAPFFEKFDLKPNRLNEQYIQLEWKEKGQPDSYFNGFHLSDGTLRFMCLATLLMQPEPPKTIIIDEPELGLHPVAINKLASLIRKASEHSQIIVSTQSTNLIDNFGVEDIIVSDRENGCSTFKRLDEKELKSWLDDYTLGDIWGKNIIGGQPY